LEDELKGKIIKNHAVIYSDEGMREEIGLLNNGKEINILSFVKQLFKTEGEDKEYASPIEIKVDEMHGYIFSNLVLMDVVRYKTSMFGILIKFEENADGDPIEKYYLYCKVNNKSLRLPINNTYESYNIVFIDKNNDEFNEKIIIQGFDKKIIENDPDALWINVICYGWGKGKYESLFKYEFSYKKNENQFRFASLGFGGFDLEHIDKNVNAFSLEDTEKGMILYENTLLFKYDDYRIKEVIGILKKGDFVKVVSHDENHCPTFKFKNDKKEIARVIEVEKGNIRGFTFSNDLVFNIVKKGSFLYGIVIDIIPEDYGSELYYNFYWKRDKICSKILIDDRYDSHNIVFFDNDYDGIFEKIRISEFRIGPGGGFEYEYGPEAKWYEWFKGEYKLYKEGTLW
jgi:hypothetical protein